MQPSPMPERSIPAHSPDAAKRVLLLDCDDRRRGIRVEALQERGALVDGASRTEAARMLWQRQSYDLVLIEMRGADADCEAFTSGVSSDRRGQKVGFYIAEQPYIIGSAARCLSSLRQDGAAVLSSDKPALEAVSGRERSGFAFATQMIAAARRTAVLAAHEKSLALESEERRLGEERLLDAVQRARQVLGGA